ncbi:MAG TPA: terminase family protein [Candidatus Limnocylindria bacterium]|nr:terminase family protein [Candidatus Limnocylindria bacterium]
MKRKPQPKASAAPPAPAPTPVAPPDLLVKSSPLDLLLGYQRDWVGDDARFKIGLMSRQVGKDFSAAAEGIRDIRLKEKDGLKTGWMIAAPSERQSLLSLEKWKDWAAAFDIAIADIAEQREGGSETLLKSTTITFPGGSKVIAVPGRPDTVRGDSLNVLLTEFAFFENPDATWRAILPTITNPLRGGEKKVRLISTPNGQGNKFHELWSKALRFGRGPANPVPRGKWSGHFVDIHTAVADGLPVDVAELRAALNDSEGWAQEFECSFLDAAAVLLPYELIALVESAEATEAVAAAYWAAASPAPVDLGIDFGRKHNLTVCWAAEQVGDLQLTREVLCLQGMSTPDQVDLLRPRLRKARRAVLDYTGPGTGMGDYLVKEFGEWKPAEGKFGKVELFTATQAAKQDIFSKLRMGFERGHWRIPVSRAIREDLHAIHRVATAGGAVTYRAPFSADGHADRCFALALCGRAGEPTGGQFRPAQTNPAGRRARALRTRRERTLA